MNLESAGLWLTPLLLLPGVALMILSTSARYARIHDEFHHLLDEGGAHALPIADNLLVRSKYFRNALVSLYSSVALFSVAGLAGGFATLWLATTFWIVVPLTCVGIIGVIYAAALLIQESRCSLEIIRLHHEQISQA